MSSMDLFILFLCLGCQLNVLGFQFLVVLILQTNMLVFQYSVENDFLVSFGISNLVY